MPDRPRVLVADPIAQAGVEILKKQAEVDVKTGLKPAALLAIVGDYNALVVRSETKVTREVIEAGSRLQVVGRAGVGVDNIDLDAATRRGIVVVNAPTGNNVAAAELAIAHMLALARNIPQANASLKAGKWERNRFLGVEVRNKCLGVIGLGKIGTEVARRARCLEMRVVGYDPFIAEEHVRKLGIDLLPFEQVVAEADFVTVHVPLTAATRNLIGERELGLMKPTARVINAARGGIVDEEALYRAVESGRIAGAAIDVFSVEPATGNILLKSEKIIVTPHLGASTAEAQVTVAVDVAEQIVAVLAGRPARYAVNVPVIPPETLPVLIPYMNLAEKLGKLATQLAEGQVETITLIYSGDMAQQDTAPLKAMAIKGLLAPISEEFVNLVNANVIAKSRGLRIIEQKGTAGETYDNMMTVQVTTNAGVTTVAGTVMRHEPHILLVDGYWIDLIPHEGYYLFSHHRDRPGMIGVVGTLLGNADINISFMQVGRLKPRGRAMMVLGLDEPMPEEPRQAILAIPDIFTAQVVRL